jgi:integrase/recombinase XerD
MTGHDVNDIHGFKIGFQQAMKRLEAAPISDHNKDLTKRFVALCMKENITQCTYTNYLNILVRIAKRLNKDLDALTESDLDLLLLSLESEGYKPGYIYNFKKTLKKLYDWLTDGEIPKFIRDMKLSAIDNQVEPKDLLTDSEAEKLLNSCKNARDRALIAILLDSGLRVGAVGSLLIGNIELGTNSGIIRPNRNSKSNKTFSKPVPITWSCGYIGQWLSVHPAREDTNSPLWINLDWPFGQAMSYKNIRAMIKTTGERAGIKKKINPHIFKHRAVSKWILERFSDQEIKHRATWSLDSRMMKVYGHFTSEDINSNILEHYGIKQSQITEIKLTNCPRCNTTLPPGARFCPQCSLVLDAKAAKEIQNYEKQIPQLIELLLKNDEAKKLLAGITK